MELNTVSKNIGLNLAKRSKPNKTSFDIRNSNITRWLNNLPRANIGATAKQIYLILQETNTLDYPYKKRMQFLDALQECITSITDSMEKHYVGASLPLADKNQKIASLNKKLFSYMAMGYKIALEDAANSPQLFGKTTHLEILAQRSICYIGKTLLASYQSYSQFPNLLWSELNNIYFFSEKQKIQNKIIDKTSIADEYSKILLLSLASPSHLQHGESRKVFNTLGRWLTRPVLRPFTASDKANDCFIIDLSQARAPSSLSSTLAEGRLNESALRVIDTNEVSKNVAHNLKEKTLSNKVVSNINKAELSNDLLQRLLITWDIKKKRNFPRSTKNEDVKLTLGLNAIHQYISQKHQTKDSEKYASKYNNQSQFTATDLSHNINQTKENKEDVWNIIYRPETKNYFEKNSIDENTVSNKEYKADDWLIVNESKMGLSINNRDELNNKVEVGELVCISRNTKDKQSSANIGTIRWLRFNADESLQIGIEIFNKNIAAIGIRSSEKPLQCALLLPEMVQMKQPAFLVTGPATWTKGNKIRMNMRGKEVSAILGSPTQNTGLFSQFRFEIDNNADIETEVASQTKNDAKKSDIWSLI